MKKVYLFLIPLLFLFSCDEKVSKIYEYEIEVVYTDSSIDTIYAESKHFEGNDPTILLRIDKGGLFTNGNKEAYLSMSYGFWENTLAYGVRRFKVLNTEIKK